MGISIPISTEYYKMLKEISDDLGLGLKRTVEFLVGYYKEKDVIYKTSTEKILEVQPDKINNSPEDWQKIVEEKVQFQNSPSAQNSSVYDTKAIEPIEITSSTIKTEKLTNLPNSQSSKICSPELLASEPLQSKKQLNSNAATKLLEQAYRSTQNCCYSCGFPKKPNAKFCSNCGTPLQAKS